jgi:hypothetical protein
MSGSVIALAMNRAYGARATDNSVATTGAPRVRPAGEIAYASASKYSRTTPRATSSVSFAWMLASVALVLRVAQIASAEQMPQSAS